MRDDVDLRDARHLAARLAARAEIRDVRLLSTKAQIDKLPGPDPRLTYRLGSDVDVVYDDGGEHFVVKVNYQLTIVEERQEHDKDPFADPEAGVATIEFAQAALFVLRMRDGDDPPKPEELQAYALSTGQLALYPYAREYIYDITGRLALPPLTVGVLVLPFDRDSSSSEPLQPATT